MHAAEVRPAAAGYNDDHDDDNPEAVTGGPSLGRRSSQPYADSGTNAGALAIR